MDIRLLLKNNIFNFKDTGIHYILKNKKNFLLLDKKNTFRCGFFKHRINHTEKRVESFIVCIL